MHLSHRLDEDICIVSIQGNLSQDTEQVIGYIKQLYLKYSFKKLLINIEKIDYFDSACLGAFLAIFNFIRKNKIGPEKIWLGFCNLSPHHQEFFKISQLHKLIHTYTSEADALAAARQA